MTSLTRKEKIICENYRTQTSRNSLVRHKKRCSAISLACPSCANFSTKSRAEMIYDIAKKHSRATAKAVHVCNAKYVLKIFTAFTYCESISGRNAEHRVDQELKMFVIQLMGDDDNGLKVELEACKDFLVDSEMESGRHRVFNFVMDTLNAKFLLEKLDVVFDSLKCAAKLTVAFGFVLKNVEDGSCRYYYAHDNFTLVERSKLVATTGDLTKLKNMMSKTDLLNRLQENEPTQNGNFAN